MKFEEEDFLSLDVENEDTKLFEAENSALHPTVLPINGIKVRFPFKPYPSQIGMMDRVLQALDGNKKHALLESPTGSGKTMALLCGVLSWMEEKRKQLPDTEPVSALSSADVNDEEPATSYFAKRVKHETIAIDDEMDEDFKASDSKTKKSSCDKSCGKDKSFSNDSDDETNAAKLIPKVYFASRTHKQLAQSIRELKRSGYQTKFTVLASRSHYCINKTVRKADDLNEACKEALAPNGPTGRCMYANKLPQFFEKQGAFSVNMDVEDLIEYGKQRRLCPYFLAREAKQHSEIIMCPYNYLIEPMIRNAMGIDLKDSIVIIDEAHNVEDVCRSAGSFEWTQNAVQTIELEIRGYFSRAEEDGMFRLTEQEAHRSMLHVCATVNNWMNGTSNFGSSSTVASNKYQSFESKIDVFEGKDICAELEKLGINLVSLAHWQVQLESIEEASRQQMNFNSNSASSAIEEKCLSSGACRMLAGFFFTLENVLASDGANANCFRLVKYTAMKTVLGKRVEEIVMGFWCLSSEIIFRSIAAEARAIILTSGTLSPMDTFASELQTNFPLQLEASHVIDSSQLFVGVFPNGPNGSELIGTFQNTNSYNFQDEIGTSIFEICKITPFGILCFLPSYALLERLLERMQNTGIYRSILRVKEIVVEPRSGSNEDFEQLIRHYYKVISDCQKNSLRGQATKISASDRRVTGAIFFAVYRGKVSEGLDFADEHARAVINVGIPYPAFKDPKVILKKEFNDRNCGPGNTNGSLLSGAQWYETQAFRALNQALGRCIRHRNDWGAVIFLDQRFTYPKNIQKLSKWVRPSVSKFSKFSEGMQKLREFMKSKGSILPEEELDIETLDAENRESSTFPTSKLHHNSSATKHAHATSAGASATSNSSKPAFFNRQGRKTLGTRHNKRPT